MLLAQNPLRREDTPMSTIDPRILRTTYVPTRLEVMQIQEVIEEEERELKKLQERIRQRGSVVSSLRRVPFEIWQAIFSLLCGEGWYSHSFKSPSLCRTSSCEDFGGILITPKPTFTSLLSLERHRHQLSLSMVFH
ncbi:hypothetical protein L218DRAFT_1080041 [Marasmius fiardii PR-910]|nr:hypothetical protein L218DRAFT_1080041 [Marasmius fiardii PR-910]